MSLIIFSNIVSGIPGGVTNYVAANAGEVQPLTPLVFLACIAPLRSSSVPSGDSDSVRPPPGGAPHLWGAELSPAVEGQHGENDPADLRVQSSLLICSFSLGR
jgi:hypothetical protein